MPEPPTVASHRAAIDALDHALLELLVERRAVVGELFALKQREGLPLVDPDREAELLAERETYATARGLPAGLAGSLFRSVLAASGVDARRL